jgi:3-hydroxyacyl-CoA dehydrogenase/enoyl-CoA hydratase/3-hydroxybutyryl-CoA epimerase
MSGFHYEKDAEGIVTVTMDMSGPVNAMNEEYREAMGATVERLEAEQGLKGVVFASAKKVFFAGGDLHALLAVQPADAEDFLRGLETVKAQLRRLEALPVPVAAAINGAALGGGLEICLACNYRVAWNDRSVELGLPEVSLGLLPGGGGVVRLTRLIGLEKALPYLLEGRRVAPDVALADGIIHAAVDDPAQLVSAARDWILAQADDTEAAIQPWDRKGFRIPGGDANSPKVAQMLPVATAMLRKKTRGLLPAPEKILDIAVQSTRLDLDTALRIESRGLTQLVVSPEAKNQISTFFFALNKVNGGASRPRDVPAQPVQKVGVLGAGMMGQGIAYAAAMAGISVILRDVSLESAEKGRAYTQRLLDRRVERGRMTTEQRDAVLARIHPTADAADLEGCDLIVEAVFENLSLKHEVTRECEPFLAEGGVWGSNTSTLPITRLAEASVDPAHFIGIHFFSPVDKMPLVEIIVGEKTSDEALARAFDFARQIRKTPIVVNDSLGFFTSRTVGTYLDEGVRLLQEGLHPVLIDNLGKAVGMPVGPLTVYDEVSLELSRKAWQTWRDMGVEDAWGDGRIAREVVRTLVEDHGRGGRHHGGGFYEYGADGSKQVWPGLLDLYYRADVCLPPEDIRDRLLFRQVIEALKCLESGVLRSEEDGNIGSIMGIGAPVWTGGLLQFVHTFGYQRFVDRCRALEAAYGERFAPPAIALERAREESSEAA